MGGGVSKKTIGEVQVAGTADGSVPPRAGVISAEAAAEAHDEAMAAGQVARPKAQQEMKRPRPAGGVRKTKDKHGDAVEESSAAASASASAAGGSPIRQAGDADGLPGELSPPQPAPREAHPFQPPVAAVIGEPVSPVSPPRKPVSVEEFTTACRQGDAATVQAFLAVNSRTAKGLADREEALFDAYGDSVLHHAVQGGSSKVVELLLGVGRIQVDIPNARNETALQFACRRGDHNLVRILLQAQADPDRRDAGGLTPFLSAVFAGGKPEILDQLSKANADVGAQDSRGVGALHFGALRGDVGLMNWLLRRKASPDAQTEHCTTPLMLAAKRGNTDGVSMLLDCKANTTLADEAGCTALMHALSSGNPEAAQKLLDSGASADAVDCAGRSALFHAVLGGNLEGLEAVIKRGGRVNILDEEGRSPLYQACLMGEQLLVECLLDADADPNLTSRVAAVRPMQRASEAGEEEEEDRESSAARACLEEARTCLQVCSTLAHTAIMTLVLDRGADINAAPGALGWTSLHLCAAVNNEEGASLLLSRGAFGALEDVEGNTAEALADRAGHEAVLKLLKEAKAAAPEVDPATIAAVPTPLAARRNLVLKGGALPPLQAGCAPPPMTEEAPEEETEPLALWRDEWTARESDGSLLDRVISPMVVDALKCDTWRLRWEAMTYLSKNFAAVAGEAPELARATAELLALSAKDKIPKVFLAALAVFEELLSDGRVDAVGPDEFAKLLRGDSEADVDALLLLLDQTDAGGGSTITASPQQAACEALCSCVMHGRVPLDEVAWPLLKRIEERLVADAAGVQDRKDKALGPKCLAANLKLLGRWLSAFGLQQSGLFRRALVLPLLLRAAASEHSKVRVAAGDAIVQLMALSGGLEDRLWQLLPSKVRRGVQKLAQEQEGIAIMAAVPCDEDAMRKEVIVAEDARGGAFLCVAELTPQVWHDLHTGERLQEGLKNKSSKKRAGHSKDDKERRAGEDDSVMQAVKTALMSKNWKDRAESLIGLAKELSAPNGEGVRCLDESESASGHAGGPLLSQYALRGHRVSALQAYLGTLLADTVTQVFCSAADVLRIVCRHVPLYIAPLFLEPLLPPLVARLVDTSKRVQQKAQETTLEVAAMHGCALSEMIAQCVASGSAWSAARPPTAGGASSSGDRAGGCDVQTGPRLQLLSKLVQTVHDRQSSGRWTEDTWQSLADYAVKAAEHRNGDVRKEAANVINSLTHCGGVAGIIADRAVAQLQALAAQQKMPKRPGTTSTRPTTGSTRLGTASGSRPGTGVNFNASGKLSNLGSTGGFSLGSTGRLSTASKRSGTGMRPGTGLNTGLRPGTGLNRKREDDEESDNSVTSNRAPDVEALDDVTPVCGEEGVKFFDVKTACPGADEAVSLEEGEAALREAMPLAEPLDEVALDFVAPLIALFGDGWTRCFYSRQWQCRVAALTHLSASMSHRLDAVVGPEVSPNALGELLDGAMRAVHEGLGDQNVRVYAEACLAVNHVVPAFCGAVDGRLLVAHLAPLLRQLCSRMGDSKEVVRLQTVQALFRLLRPPTGNIVSPIAIGMLILRHMAPAKEGEPAPRTAANDKGARTGWLCRIGALRDLVKEHTKNMVHQPGAMHPGEWLRLKDGLIHGDDMVRYETARLYALVCKVHLKCLGDEEAQREGREAWVAALPPVPETPPKSISQVRKLLKLPDDFCDEVTLASSLRRGLNGSGKLGATSTPLPSASTWEVPMSLAIWAGCSLEVLDSLRRPAAGDEQAVAGALKALSKAVVAFAEQPKRRDAKPEEAFAQLCRAVQQAISSAVGGDRGVFLAAVELCQLCVSQLAPALSGLDINMGLAKTIPTIMERASLSGSCDVKVGVASDKLLQQLAKHPKVGAEAVTKIVINAVSRTEKPIRPLVLLRTLLGDFGLRLCAQRDVVSLLLAAVVRQMEMRQLEKTGSPGGAEDADALRPQLVGVLATVNQFSPETMQHCMSEVEPAHRKLIAAALQEAPNPRLVALGATAAEQAQVQHVAGSAVRAASRDRRGQSPKPDDGESPTRSRNVQASPDGRSRRVPAGLPRGPEETEASPDSRSGRRGVPGLPRGPEDAPSRGSSSRHLGEASPTAGSSGGREVGGGREASPRGHGSSRRNRRVFRDEPVDRSAEGSPASLADCGGSSPTDSPPARIGFGRHASTGSIGMTSTGSNIATEPTGSRGLGWSGGGARPALPPAPMGLSTRLSGGDASWEFNGQAAGSSEGRRLHRTSSSEFVKGKEKSTNESLSSLMDVLSQMDTRKSR